MLPLDDDDFDDDSPDADVFFDCNETSVSQYLSIVRERQRGNDDDDDGVSTNVAVRLAELTATVRFDDDEYLSATLDDLKITTSSSKRTLELSVESEHLEMEDLVVTTTDGRSSGRRISDVGRLLRFEEEQGDFIIDPPPCVSVSLRITTTATNDDDNKSDRTTDTKHVVADVSLRPLELVYRETTLRNVRRLLTVLDTDGDNDHDDDDDGGPAKAIRYDVRCMGHCPLLDMLLFANRRLASKEFRTLFARERRNRRRHATRARFADYRLELGLERRRRRWISLRDGTREPFGKTRRVPVLLARPTA